MNRRGLLRTLLQAAALGVGRPAASQPSPRVVFLNPGEAIERGTGPYWRTVSRYMAIAARSLGMTLDVLYADRDHLLMLRQAEQVAQQSPAPDFVVIVNEKMEAPQMLRTLSRSTAKVLVIHNDVTALQRTEIGDERQGHPRWIGTAVADNARGGYRLMQELYRQLGAREAHIIGITGDPKTPVSLERARGVADFVEQARRGRMLQLTYSDWSYADGEHKARVLLARYPQANVIWAANDSMALGALRATPTHRTQVLVGGNGGWAEAIESLGAGGLAATAAGHALIGAWAIVMLYDYARGLDFADHGGPVKRIDYLHVLNRERGPRYARALFDNADTLDFRAFSRTLTPRPGGYDFRIDPLLRTVRAS